MKSLDSPSRLAPTAAPTAEQSGCRAAGDGLVPMRAKSGHVVHREQSEGYRDEFADVQLN
ncbi:hypothetical protein PG989_011120 [Apiospora arundinis]|uniref:DUF397 domain-containing protein n=1 Tax=Apiospora arundinis TaxID=335852 RepID=A0ABR2HRJ4_9PEZI